MLVDHKGKICEKKIITYNNCIIPSVCVCEQTYDDRILTNPWSHITSRTDNKIEFAHCCYVCA